MYNFEAPYLLLLLLLLPLLAFIRRDKTALNYSALPQDIKPSLKQRLSILPAVCRFLAMACLIIAIAGPRSTLEFEKRSTNGIAMMVAIDRSGSMQEVLPYKGQRANRLTVVKDLFQEFALGNGKLKGRDDDLIGIVSFAGYASTACPLTLAHDAIPLILKNIELPTRKEEDGTAIGDAIALAAARLQKTEENLKKQNAESDDPKYTIKSKVIILLTDGQNNRGKRTPLEAAELAAKWGIKIYTIGVGGGEDAQAGFGGFFFNLGSGVDEQTLKAIAAKANGKFFMANSAKDLEDIYKEIDSLEKTEFNANQSVHYKEEFWNFALAAFILIVLEVLLSTTYLRRLP